MALGDGSGSCGAGPSGPTGPAARRPRRRSAGFDSPRGTGSCARRVPRTKGPILPWLSPPRRSPTSCTGRRSARWSMSTTSDVGCVRPMLGGGRQGPTVVSWARRLRSPGRRAEGPGSSPPTARPNDGASRGGSTRGASVGSHGASRRCSSATTRGRDACSWPLTPRARSSTACAAAGSRSFSPRVRVSCPRRSTVGWSSERTRGPGTTWHAARSRRSRRSVRAGCAPAFRLRPWGWPGVMRG